MYVDVSVRYEDMTVNCTPTPIRGLVFSATPPLGLPYLRAPCCTTVVQADTL